MAKVKKAKKEDYEKQSKGQEQGSLVNHSISDVTNVTTPTTHTYTNG